MPLRYGWLQAPLTASSTKKVLNVPQRARLRAFLVCILVNVALAQPRLEIHFVTRSKSHFSLRGRDHRTKSVLPSSSRTSERGIGLCGDYG